MQQKIQLAQIFEPLLFFGIIGIIIRVHGLKGKFDQNNLKESEKGVKSLKLEKPGPPKLVCKHFTNLYLH